MQSPDDLVAVAQTDVLAHVPAAGKSADPTPNGEIYKMFVSSNMVRKLNLTHFESGDARLFINQVVKF